MTLMTGSGSLPAHVYCLVDRRYTRTDADGLQPQLEPCVWFGLRSYPGRAWGCHVLLECGAMVRDLPLHALAHGLRPQGSWSVQQAQTWDCYGLQWSAHRYEYLQGLEAQVKCGQVMRGDYLFTVVPIGDAFTAEPEQAKEFSFFALNNGRFTAQPTNHVLFEERSFTSSGDWPTNIRLQSTVWAAETETEEGDDVEQQA